jgi:hypothetical protein
LSKTKGGKISEITSEQAKLTVVADSGPAHCMRMSSEGDRDEREGGEEVDSHREQWFRGRKRRTKGSKQDAHKREKRGGRHTEFS